MPFYGLHRGKYGNVVCETWDEVLTMNKNKGVKVKKFVNREDAAYFAEHGSQRAEEMDPNYMHVWTDGSAVDNSGGVGVYWGTNHSWNVSEPFTEHPITNNRAELKAVIIALRSVPDPAAMGTLPLCVHSDSMYVINCMTKYIHKWRQNGWLKTDKQPVENQELIKDCWSELERHSHRVKFEHVKAHHGRLQNEMADRFAFNAATVKK